MLFILSNDSHQINQAFMKVKKYLWEQRLSAEDNCISLCNIYSTWNLLSSRGESLEKDLFSSFNKGNDPSD